MAMNEIYGILAVGVCTLLGVAFLIGNIILIKKQLPEALVWANHVFSGFGVCWALDALGAFKFLFNI
jgi:hypothetical protein